MIIDELKKAGLVGVGSIALATEKTNESIQNLVNKGKLSVEEGKQLTNELVKRNKSESRSFSEEDRNELEAVLIDMNVAQSQDIASLEERIAQLEERIQALETNN